MINPKLPPQQQHPDQGQELQKVQEQEVEPGLAC